jgi:hypothetical protein
MTRHEKVLDGGKLDFRALATLQNARQPLSGSQIVLIIGSGHLKITGTASKFDKFENYLLFPEQNSKIGV